MTRQLVRAGQSLREENTIRKLQSAVHDLEENRLTELLYIYIYTIMHVAIGMQQDEFRRVWRINGSYIEDAKSTLRKQSQG